jgi:hypothetical protein
VGFTVLIGIINPLGVAFVFLDEWKGLRATGCLCCSHIAPGAVGTSYSAGHCVVVAAQDRRIAAVVSMTPAMDGFATLLHLMRQGEIGLLLSRVFAV